MRTKKQPPPVQELPIQEMFRSIHGEGSFIGTPCAFIRTINCNRSCSFCFGIKLGRHVPRAIKSTKRSVRLDKIKKGDKLLTYDKDLSLVETTVKEVHSREVEVWYDLKIAGKQYFVTPEHPFFTTRGEVTAENLKVGDSILHSCAKDKVSFRMRMNNPAKNPASVLKRVANTDWVARGRKQRLWHKKQVASGKYVPSFYTLSSKERDVCRKKNSDAKKGSKNPNWKGGKHQNWKSLKTKCSKGILSCELCKKNKKLEVHHVDGKQDNDSRSNLICICHRCHSKIHSRGYNFWVTGRSDKKRLQGVVRANGFTVESKKLIDLRSKQYYGKPYGPKKLKVFNLTCAPYNTFLLDYMWVHNCDTGYGKVKTEHVSSVKDYGQLIDFIEESIYVHKIGLFCITGGEPLLHPDLVNSICDVVHLNIAKVAIETNGDLLLSESVITTLHSSSFDKIVISPKEDFVFNKDWRARYTSQYLLTDTDIKFVVSDTAEFLRITEHPDFKELTDLFPVFLQPCAPAMSYEKLVEIFTKSPVRGVTLLPQLHKIYGWR